jgi:hypothetical protein
MTGGDVGEVPGWASQDTHQRQYTLYPVSDNIGQVRSRVNQGDASAEFDALR